MQNQNNTDDDVMMIVDICLHSQTRPSFKEQESLHKFIPQAITHFHQRGPKLNQLKCVENGRSTCGESGVQLETHWGRGAD